MLSVMIQMWIQTCLAESLKWGIRYWNILENNQCYRVKNIAALDRKALGTGNLQLQETAQRGLVSWLCSWFTFDSLILSIDGEYSDSITKR